MGKIITGDETRVNSVYVKQRGVKICMCMQWDAPVQHMSFNICHVLGWKRLTVVCLSNNII